MANLTNKKKRLLNNYSSALKKADLAALIEASGDGNGSTPLLSEAWFVDLKATTDGNGSIGSPFNLISSANAASTGVGIIYIFGGATSVGGANVNEFPILQGRSYNFLTPAIIGCRPTLVADPGAFSNITTDIKGDLILIDVTAITGTDPWLTFDIDVWLKIECAMFAINGSPTFTNVFESDVGGGSGLLIVNSQILFGNQDAGAFIYNRNNSISVSLSFSTIEVGDANVFDFDCDADISVKSGGIRNDSNTKSTISIAGGTSCLMEDGGVGNDGTAPALSMADNTSELQISSGCHFDVSGDNPSIVRSGTGTMYLCACADLIDLGGSGVNVFSKTPSVITTSAGVPDIGVYPPFAGQFCYGDVPSKLYCCEGDAWVQCT